MPKYNEPFKVVSWVPIGADSGVDGDTSQTPAPVLGPVPVSVPASTPIPEDPWSWNDVLDYQADYDMDQEEHDELEGDDEDGQREFTYDDYHAFSPIQSDHETVLDPELENDLYDIIVCIASEL